MSRCRPMLWLLLALPIGIATGFVSVALANALARTGIAESDTGDIVATLFLAPARRPDSPAADAAVKEKGSCASLWACSRRFQSRASFVGGGTGNAPRLSTSSFCVQFQHTTRTIRLSQTGQISSASYHLTVHSAFRNEVRR
jgi:hypothetical protein